jgi:hypothetical protein
MDILALKINGAQAVTDLEQNCWIQTLSSRANFNFCSGLPENTLHPLTLCTSGCLSTSLSLRSLQRSFSTSTTDTSKSGRSLYTHRWKKSQKSADPASLTNSTTSMTSWMHFPSVKSSRETSASSNWWH